MFFIAFVILIIGDKPQEYDAILWNPEKRLNWGNFKGKPTNNRAAAITASGVTYQFSTYRENDVLKIDFTVSAFFYPNKSWYRAELCDSIILGHEQLHFDITELYARKFRQQLNEIKFTNNVKAEVKAIYDDITRQLNDFQNRYDAETNFSRNRDKQLIWNKKISDALILM